MYRAFRLSEYNFNRVFIEDGEKQYNLFKGFVEKALGGFTSHGRINGSALRDSWFPEINADVFISHSHQNQDFALALSGWLKRHFGVRSFVDSIVWGHSDKLLRRIDKVHSWVDERDAFDYDLRNQTTSHVHMMLATALTRMIDRCECIIFLDTPASVFHSQSSKEVVRSPWIYFELDQISKIRTRKPDRTELLKEARQINFSAKDSDLKIEYEPDFSSLTGIGLEELKRWSTAWKHPTTECPSPLDALYQIAMH